MVFHCLGFRRPIVTQRSMGIGFGFSTNGFRALMGTANPRLRSMACFIATTPNTIPWRSTMGPPLFPCSVGMATWIMSLS